MHVKSTVVHNIHTRMYVPVINLVNPQFHAVVRKRNIETTTSCCCCCNEPAMYD